MKHEAYLDLVLAVQLVVVQRFFRHRSTPLVHILHERNVFLRRDKTNLVQIGVSKDKFINDWGLVKAPGYLL